jgi:N-acyl-phosphatidylethanolamine-hydrolysing phospholipase D
LQRWFAGRLRGRLNGTLPKAPEAAAFEVVASAITVPRGRADECRVTWVGHSTCLLQVGGVNILTDPVWSEHAFPVQGIGPRRIVPAAVPFDALPPLDLVLLSHNHYDHFDTTTIRDLVRWHPSARWACALGVSPALADLGVRATTEFDWWERRVIPTPAGGVTVTATPAQHFSGRTPFDRDATLWCGFAVEVGGWRVLFVGDTGLHPEFGQIAAACGPFDVALVPVGAYAPRWFMRPVHMNPEEALDAFDAVAPNGHRCAFVPIHWGTFRLTDEPMDEPPRRVREGWRARGRAADDLWVLRHGETRVASKP